MAQKEIWQARVSDDTIQYFISQHEAEFYQKDTTAAGFTVCISPVPIPQTARDFIAFMERREEDRRGAIKSLREALDHMEEK